MHTSEYGRTTIIQPPSWAEVDVTPVVEDLSALNISDPDSGSISVSSDDSMSRPVSPTDELIEALEDAIMQTPDEMLENLKTIHSKRRRCGPWEPELRNIAAAFSNFSGHCRDEDVEGAELEYRSTWDQLWRTGLGHFCEEVAVQSDFYEEHPYWILTILDMVDATITRYATDTVVADYEGPHMKQLRRIILALCHAGYPNRELFMDDIVVLKTYAPGVSLELRFRFQHMLNMSYPFYLKAVGDKIFSMGSPGDTKAFRRMATLLWYYRSPEEGWQPESLITFSLQILTESSENDYFDFYDNDIVKLMGPFNFLTSLSGNLRRGDFPSPVFHERLLQNLGPVIAIYHLWPHYSSSGFFASLREVLDSYASLEGSRRWNIWEAGLHILMRITDQAPINEGASPLIRHFDIVELMARSSILYVQTDTTKVDHNTCLKIIEDYTRIAEALHLRAGKNTLRKAFRQAARREWYPTLKVLRELPLRDRRTLPKCTKLIPAWQDLGRALDLDEANEKADFEREMKKAAQMCAWFECEYHEKKPPHPTRACVGCAEARYCSRLCQQRDWREGGHKQKCKRLKSEPHRPRGES